MRARALLASVLLGAGCHGGGEGAGEPSPSPSLPAVPAPFAGRENPLPNDPATIERGRMLFRVNCVPCHGPEGEGNGVASAGLNPPPANFRDPNRLPSRGDDYVFWRISTGIPATAMPAFGATLSEEDRWAILRFLRSLRQGPPR